MSVALLPSGEKYAATHVTARVSPSFRWVLDRCDAVESESVRRDAGGQNVVGLVRHEDTAQFRNFVSSCNLSLDDRTRRAVH